LFKTRFARWLSACWLQWVEAVQGSREHRERDATRKGRADQRALSLLLALLNEEQRGEFQASGHFHVTGVSSGVRYRIRRDSAVNIDVLAEDDIVRFRLCARPAGNIPMYDVMAGQLLYLQDSDAEARFLEQANRHMTIAPTTLVGGLERRAVL
jgi:hypothetical protein